MIIVKKFVVIIDNYSQNPLVRDAINMRRSGQNGEIRYNIDNPVQKEYNNGWIFKAPPHNSRRTPCLNLVPSDCPKIGTHTSQSAHLNYAVLP